MSSLQVAVVGAGIGGLATASALSHRGVDVQVYEHARQLGELGAGVALGSNSIRLLERLGLEGPLRDYGPRWTQWRFNAAEAPDHLLGKPDALAEYVVKSILQEMLVKKAAKAAKEGRS